MLRLYLLVLLTSCSSYVLVPTPPVHTARAIAPQCKLGFSPRPLVAGEDWDGIVSKITDYGCFVRMGGGEHLGLLHIKELADGVRMQKDEIADFVEDVRTSGPH